MMQYDLSNQPDQKSISFCVTCRNRRWQIEQTLEANLTALDRMDEIVLVDYCSTDGLSEWVWSRFKNQIDTGQLVFFEVEGHYPWHASKAKNLSHRLATKNYLFNLDADNFISKHDVSLIQQMAQANMACHQWSGNQSNESLHDESLLKQALIDGSFGRIGLSSALFLKLGGYDEGLLPVTQQDLDLIYRIHMSGCQIGRLPNVSRSAVMNDVYHKMSELKTVSDLDTAELYNLLNKTNRELSRLKHKIEGPYRTANFATYKGKLNGRLVVIDGLNRLTYE